MKKKMSIRLRLTAWYAAAMLLGLALFGLAMWLALEQRLLAGLDARLEQRMQGLRIVLEGEESGTPDGLRQELSEFAAELPEGGTIQLWDPSGALILPFPDQPAFPKEPAAQPAAHRTLSQRGRPFRTLAVRARAHGRLYDVLIANSLDEALGVMRDFRQFLFLMIPAVLAVACLGGYWLSRRALRPVDEITSIARSIGVQNLTQRVLVPRTGDELQRMAETWNVVLGRLEIAVQRIRRFTADASHELRTPLALIQATAELALRRDRTPEEYRASLGTIEDEARQMTALTEALLTMARADAHELNMELTSTDLAELVYAVVRQYEAAAAQKGVRLTVETGGRGAFALADAGGMRRLLVILVDNALRHTPAGGAVSVAVVPAAGSVELSVSDTGEGIAPDKLPHIFERFYRGDPARGSGSGFGLGLSIAQAIAQAHGSEIKVSSAAGAGARFSVALCAPSALPRRSG